ncbi:hypothetical protein ACRRGR_003246 [Vibrio alginolyticus]
MGQWVVSDNLRNRLIVRTIVTLVGIVFIAQGAILTAFPEVIPLDFLPITECTTVQCEFDRTISGFGVGDVAISGLFISFLGCLMILGIEQLYYCSNFLKLVFGVFLLLIGFYISHYLYFILVVFPYLLFFVMSSRKVSVNDEAEYYVNFGSRHHKRYKLTSKDLGFFMSVLSSIVATLLLSAAAWAIT